MIIDEIIGMANRTDETDKVVVHLNRPHNEGKKLRCKVLSIRHVKYDPDQKGTVLCENENYWGGSRLMIGMDKDGQPLFIISSYDSGEGTARLTDWLYRNNIGVNQYIDARQILDDRFGDTTKNDRVNAVKLIKKYLTGFTLEQKTVINGLLPGSYRGSALFGKQ